MENRIKQEINKTLECMGEGVDIQISPLFAENLSSRIANMRVSGNAGYRSRAFYPVVILLMVVLNVAALMVNFAGQKQANGDIDYQVNVIANEYGIGQGNYMNF